MYGNMCVVYTTGIWLLLASFFELPVSTTHSTIGGIVGMAMAYRGPDCVLWHEDTDVFPYLKVTHRDETTIAHSSRGGFKRYEQGLIRRRLKYK